MYTNHDYDLTYVLHVEPRDLDNYANPDYYWLYDSPEVQELLAAAKTSPDPDEANELRRQAAEQIAEDAPAVWLTWPTTSSSRAPASPASPSSTSRPASTPATSRSPASDDELPSAAAARRGAVMR